MLRSGRDNRFAFYANTGKMFLAIAFFAVVEIALAIRAGPE